MLLMYRLVPYAFVSRCVLCCFISFVFPFHGRTFCIPHHVFQHLVRRLLAVIISLSGVNVCFYNASLSTWQYLYIYIYIYVYQSFEAECKEGFNLLNLHIFHTKIILIINCLNTWLFFLHGVFSIFFVLDL
jgi:hypothetical protein